jgi:hypothetical protein
MCFSVLLPTRLSHAWNYALVSHLAKANTAQAELAIHRSGTAAQLTAAPELRAEFRFQFCFRDFCFAGH